MTVILNLTQHKATHEQLAAGVVDLPEEFRITLCDLLTFTQPPSKQDIQGRAYAIADMVDNFHPDDEIGVQVLIGGAPWLMSHLEAELKNRGFVPLYSFSERVSVEVTQPDGSVKKVSTFKHVAFVEV